jgi:glycosyltransferase involved in cell wall biosynthesis
VHAAIQRHGLEGIVEAPGRVSSEEVQAALRSALCVVSASTREGFGLIVIEAAAAGTPVVVAATGPDNAAAELVEPGVNGFVARTATASALADAIVSVHRAGARLRESTDEWYKANENRFSAEVAVADVLDTYELSR